MKELIKTNNAPEAIGPYSQAVKTGNLLFISGQLPIDPETGKFSGETIEKQTEQVLKNLQAVITAGGSNLENVVKSTCFIKDMEDFSSFNTVYSRFFSENPPARECVEVSRLPKDALIEISVVCECL